MLLDGASGLLLILGISIVLNVVVFMYFRNKTMALENKVDIMFNIVQEHAAMNNVQQPPPVPQSESFSGGEEMQQNADIEESDLNGTKNPELISVSDVNSDDDSDSESESDDSESDEDENIAEEILTNQVLVEDNNIISNGEVISIEQVQQGSNESNEVIKEININEETPNQQVNVVDDSDDSDSDDSDSDDSDSDDSEGNGEPLVIIKNDGDIEKTQQNLLDIQDLVETVETELSGLEKEEEEEEEEEEQDRSPLPPNLKKLTVVQLKELVMERWPNMEEAISKMKKKELLGILKA
tara:strand:- start:746 stop:1636 length:891 start_codon:yes stop_codon:yes gene_type:complete